LFLSLLAMALSGNDEAKFKQLSAKTYKDQAIWFLNAYWKDFGQKEAERIWTYKHKCDELDLQNRAAGTALDELNAHRFLEAFKEPLTVREMRETLRNSGVIEKFSNVPLIHFLIAIFKSDWHYVVNAPQGDNREEIEKAQRMLDAVQAAFRESEAKAQAAAVALREAESREREARQKEAEAEAAKRELEVALADLKAQETAYENKTKEIQSRIDSASGVVGQNKAKAELAQHLNEPTLPLRKARITQEAAVKKADRARAAAEASTAQAVEARKASAKAKEAAEQAVEDARQKVDEAEKYLEEVKNKPGSAQGSIWWLERELHEAKAFLPERKGGYKKDRPDAK